VRSGDNSWSSLDSYDDPLIVGTPPKRPRKALEHLHTTSHSGKLPFGRVSKRARTNINATTPSRALTRAQLAELDMLAVAVTRLLTVRARTPPTKCGQPEPVGASSDDDSDTDSAEAASAVRTERLVC
jgi:hypothetical protein